MVLWRWRLGMGGGFEMLDPSCEKEKEDEC